MSRRSPRTSDGARTVLASGLVVLLTVLTVLGAVGMGSESVTAQGSTEYVIVQDGECRPLDPLGDGSQSVEAFYDYRSPETDPSGWYHAYGDAEELLREDTSQVFLYRGSDGLSLVFLHDGAGSNVTSGGTVEADLSGLPADGEWVVEDDDYAGQDDDEFDGGQNAHATWAWNEGVRSDGGAYSGLDGEDWEEIEIRMAFNEESDMYPYDRWNGDPEDNEIDSWIARSGDETYDLDMDEPITVARGTCEGAVTSAAESTDGTETATSSDSNGSSAGSANGNDSGGLPIDVPSVPEAPSGDLGSWISGQIAGMSEANPMGVLVLLVALVAIAFVTLRR